MISFWKNQLKFQNVLPFSAGIGSVNSHILDLGQVYDNLELDFSPVCKIDLVMMPCLLAFYPLKSQFAILDDILIS
jgi:hypothetical protein